MAPPDHKSIGTVVKLLHAIRQMLLMMKRGLLHEINFHVFCEGMSTLKSQQERKLKNIDLSQVVGQAGVTSFEVQNVMSCVMTSFAKTMNVLDLFGDFLESPSEETSEKLKQLCDREKSTGDELLTTHEIDETFDFLRSFLTDETKKPQNLNSQKHAVLELSSTINSVSREASEKDLEPNLEKHRREKQHFMKICNIHHDKFYLEQDSRNKNKSENFKNYQERRIKAMENEIHLLRAENKEIMAELGQITVEKTARENERRKSELFNQIYRSSSAKAKQSVVFTGNDKLITEDDALGHPNDYDNTLQKRPRVNKSASTSNASGKGFTKPQATNENADLTSLVSKATSSKQNVQGVESLVKENDHQPRKKEIMTNDKDETNLHDGDQNGTGILTHNNENKNLKTENLPKIASKKKTSGGEGIDQSGNVTGRSDAASASREGSDKQSLNQQSYESLSFSVQQDYSNEQEKISLSNVPPTSVATTLYNNYKLLLLSLGQMLLSNDVTKLMAWATQNFPIVNPQNATHVLFQLDENEVINASDLSQLRHFFESIVRFDLVYVIDAFLLGDYGTLRQITASKKRDVTATQNPQTGTTTRYQNLFSAASTSQFSLRGSSLTAENSNEPRSSVLQQKHQLSPPPHLTHPTPNDAQFLPRSNENQSTAYGATGFTVDDPVTNERRTTTGNSSTNANSSGTRDETDQSIEARTDRHENNDLRSHSQNHFVSNEEGHSWERGDETDQSIEARTNNEENNDQRSPPQNHFASNEEGDSRKRGDETDQSVGARANSEENNDQRSSPQNHFASSEEGDSRERGLLGQRQSRRNISEEDSTTAQCSNGQTGTLREPLPGESQAHETDTNDQRNPTLAATSSPTATLLIQGIPQSLDEVEVITFFPGIAEALGGYDNRLDVPHTVPSL